MSTLEAAGGTPELRRRVRAAGVAVPALAAAVAIGAGSSRHPGLVLVATAVIMGWSQLDSA